MSKAESGITQEEVEKTDILNYLEEVSQKTEGKLSCKKYDKKREAHMPSSMTVMRKFGSWNKAKEKANLNVSVKQESYKKQRILKSLRKVSQKTEGKLSCNKYKKKREDDMPCYHTIINKFDSWNKAKEKAGLNLTKKYNEEEVIEALKRVDKRVEGILTRDEYEENKDSEDPTAGAIETRFSGWNPAKREAGLRVIKSAFSKEECKKTIREVNKKVNGYLSYSKYEDMRRENQPSHYTMERKFSSWMKAKEAAGLEFDRHYRGKGKRNRDDGKFYDKEFTEGRRKALERDSHKCKLCGMTQEEHFEEYDSSGLEAHHIYSIRSFDNGEENNIDRGNQEYNLVCLCKSCHNKIEKRTPRKQLEIIGDSYEYDFTLPFILNWSRFTEN